MRKLLFLFVVCIFQFGFAQNNKNQETDIISHQVKLGETVRMLSKKYLVDPAEIYKLNKFAVEGIKEGMVLQIPVPRKEAVQQEEPVANNTAETTPQNDEQPVAVEQPVKNEQPVVKENPVEVSTNASPNEHTVISGETLYSLSRQYNVSVDAIKMANEGGLQKGLKVGQVIKVPSSGNANEPKSTVTEKTSKTSETTQTPNEPMQGNSVTHTVAPKETLYSLSKKYGVTVDDIKVQNPDVAAHGLQIGQILKITKN